MTNPIEPVVSVTNYAERMAMRFGFRSSSSRWLACPRYAAGRRCKQMYAAPNNQCRAHYGWFDHSYQWIAPDGYRVFTTEPYANTIGAEHIRKLRDGIEELDLSMTVIDRENSMWFPGSTVLIMVHSPKWVPDQRLQREYDRWVRGNGA